jgi:DNA-binding transcriptional regulator GbsR (MarR family)
LTGFLDLFICSDHIVHSTMNNMKKQVDVKTDLAELSASVGHFISYWGFRSIHGQIWTQVYLSKTPLNGAELTGRLSVSKALISPALVELESYGLIRSQFLNKKTKTYTAEIQIIKIIKKILKTRELNIIKKCQKNLSKLSITIKKNKSDLIHQDRLLKMEKMILLAQLAVRFLIETDVMNEYEKFD